MIVTGNDNKKLKKVLSTKLSVDDYNVFRILTNQAYRSGAISQDSPSEMLRYMITPVVDGFRKIPGFSLLQIQDSLVIWILHITIQEFTYSASGSAYNLLLTVHNDLNCRLGNIIKLSVYLIIYHITQFPRLIR